jgi:ketosteroid isomerase-like protein
MLASMIPEANKQAVTDLFARFSAGDVAGVLAMMADDVTWRLPGRRALLPIAGEYTKERLKRMFDGMLAQLDERGLQMRVVGLVAEGDDVAAEVESIGDLRNGRQYRQQYHFLIRFRDGKIVNVREYLDTHHAFDVWIRS